MTAIAQPTAPVPATRRQRAAVVVERALRGGILGAAVAAIAWLVAIALAGTVFVVLVVATIAAGAHPPARGKAPPRPWVGAAGESLAEPWGSSWLWLPAVLGPVLGARTLLNPSPSKP